MARKTRSRKTKRQSRSQQEDQFVRILKGCGILFGALIIIGILTVVVQPVQDFVVTIFAALLEFALLSNLFVLNLLVIAIILVLIGIAIYVYSKL